VQPHREGCDLKMLRPKILYDLPVSLFDLLQALSVLVCNRSVSREEAGMETQIDVRNIGQREDMPYLINSKQIHWQPKHLAPLILPRHLRNWKICTHNYTAFQVAYIESVESRGHEMSGEFEGMQSSFQRSWICDVCLVKH